MNWKRLLYFDLRRVIPGSGSTSTGPAEPWVVRRRRQRQERAGMKAMRSLSIMDEVYKPCPMYRIMGGERWRGPVYISTAHWRSALVHVLSQMESLARANVNFVTGLEVAAAEEQRLRQGARLLYFWSILRASVPSLIVAAVAFVSSIRLLENLDVVALGLFSGIVWISLIPAWFMLLRTERLEAALLCLRDRMAGGRSLSEAMRSMPRMFPPFICDYVQAGESCGQLPQVLKQLNDDTVRMLTQGRYIRLQFMYLGMVLLMQSLLIAFIVAKVVPVLNEILREMGAAPPLFLRMAQDLSGSQVLRFVCIVGVGVILLLWLVMRRLRQRPLSTRLLGTPMLLIPWLRGYFMQHNLSLASFILEKLLRVGVPLDRALETAAASGMHPLYRALFSRLRTRLMQGETLSEACASETRLLPGSFRAMVGVGERSGLLAESLLQLHEVYQRGVETRTRMLVDILVPVGVLSLGALTLTVEASLFAVLASLADTLSTPGL